MGVRVGMATWASGLTSLTCLSKRKASARNRRRVAVITFGLSGKDMFLSYTLKAWGIAFLFIMDGEPYQRRFKKSREVFPPQDLSKGDDVSRLAGPVYPIW